jgi:hypothetical protein
MLPGTSTLQSPPRVDAIDLGSDGLEFLGRDEFQVKGKRLRHRHCSGSECERPREYTDIADWSTWSSWQERERDFASEETKYRSWSDSITIISGTRDGRRSFENHYKRFKRISKINRFNKWSRYQAWVAYCRKLCAKKERREKEKGKGRA